MHPLLILLGGAASAQAITIVASPILSRIFSASDFGSFAVYTGLVYFINSFSSLRLEAAILAAKNDQEREDLKRLSIVSLLGTVCLLLMVLFALFGATNKVDIFYVMALPLGVLVSGLFNVFVNDALRENKIKHVSFARFIQSGSGIGTQLLMGVFFGGVTSLVGGQVVGLIMGLLVIASISLNTNALKNLTKCYGSLRLAFSKYKNYVVYDSAGAAMSVAANHLPTMMMALMLGSAMGGYYYMAARVMVLPLGIIAVSTSQYIGARYNQWTSVGLFESNIQKAVDLSLSSMVLPLMLFGLISKPVFELVLGEEWSIAGEVAGWCGIWLGFKFVYDCLSVSLTLSSRQRAAMHFQLVLLVIRVFIVGMGSGFLAPIDVIKVYCISSSIIYFAGVVMICSMDGVERAWSRPISKVIMASCIAVPLYILVDGHISVSGATLAGMVMYFLVMFFYWFKISLAELVVVKKMLSEK